jgi:fluoroacetyl-CoA thioesterase
MHGVAGLRFLLIAILVRKWRKCTIAGVCRRRMGAGPPAVARSSGGVAVKSAPTGGTSATTQITVDRGRTIDFLGEQLRIYATPELVRDFEIACRALLRQYCEPNEDSVGTAIRVAHSGATLLGMRVTITVQVTRAEGRSVSFALSARDDLEEIATGEHSRAVVDVERLRARVSAKAEKLRGS